MEIPRAWQRFLAISPSVLGPGSADPCFYVVKEARVMEPFWSTKCFCDDDKVVVNGGLFIELGDPDQQPVCLLTQS
jgi:hypothetical protein